ncbi:hypothetical protein IT413_02505 [Candidatus Peregrinibacteria bacterium]|nr:hypothetical protein [Candidatus Peregrinibacteria bacterium]
MSKFTLFTLFLCTMIMVVVAEMLVNDYVDTPNSVKQFQASVLQTMEVADPTGGTDSKAKSGGTVNEKPDPNLSYLSFGLVQSAGFEDTALQRIPFNGILFETIDLRDFKSVDVISNNFLEHNRTQIGTMNEFHAQSRDLADEIFNYLKEKSGKLIGASVNETNTFGERSFYINFLELKDNAFLVVKQGENVYALTYKKGEHSNVQSLLKLLPS